MLMKNGMILTVQLYKCGIEELLRNSLVPLYSKREWDNEGYK